MMYGPVCTEFYDADKKFAPSEEVNFYKKFFHKNDLILEPMCGSGRLLIPLLQAGYIVHGIDSSSAMLKSCMERAVKLGLKPVLHEGEIEEMAFSDRYNGITIPYGSFQSFYPRTLAYKVLEILRNHLQPNGKLILDLFIPWEALYKNGQDIFKQRDVTISVDSIIRVKNHEQTNKYEQYYIANTQYEKIVNDKVVAVENSQIYVCWYYRYEAELILEKFGYRNIAYSERVVNGRNHMTFVAQKV